MQKYSTIIGVITLRLHSESYNTVQKRYSIGSSTVTLIMNRFKESGLSLDDLKRMEPKNVLSSFCFLAPYCKFICCFLRNFGFKMIFPAVTGLHPNFLSISQTDFSTNG